MDFEVIVVELQAAGGDDVLAEGEGEVADRVGQVRPVQPVGAVGTERVGIQVLRRGKNVMDGIEARPVVRDAEGEIVSDVAFEKGIKRCIAECEFSASAGLRIEDGIEVKSRNLRPELSASCADTRKQGSNAAAQTTRSLFIFKTHKKVFGETWWNLLGSGCKSTKNYL